MIGCDNPRCPVEWYHYQCVGLAHHPSGEWLCPRCTAAAAAGAGNKRHKSDRDAPLFNV
jgi:hypothetical protein